MRVPHIYDMVLRAREQKISLGIELDLSQGPFVAYRKFCSQLVEGHAARIWTERAL